MSETRPGICVVEVSALTIAPASTIGNSRGLP